MCFSYSLLTADRNAGRGDQDARAASTTPQAAQKNSAAATPNDVFTRSNRFLSKNASTREFLAE
jgi:hypothetical protein